MGAAQAAQLWRKLQWGTKTLNQLSLQGGQRYSSCSLKNRTNRMLLLKSVGYFIMRNLTCVSLLHFSGETQQSKDGQTGPCPFPHFITQNSCGEQPFQSSSATLLPKHYHRLSMLNCYTSHVNGSGN